MAPEIYLLFFSMLIAPVLFLMSVGVSPSWTTSDTVIITMFVFCYPAVAAFMVARLGRQHRIEFITSTSYGTPKIKLVRSTGPKHTEEPIQELGSVEPKIDVEISEPSEEVEIDTEDNQEEKDN